MPLGKTNLDKLDFAKLYKEQMKNSTFKRKSSADWDKKAQYFSENVLNSPYTQEFTSRLSLKNCETLLDVGSGPGTISLALAPKLKQVYALDYSKEMLSFAKENAKKLEISNLKTINKSWYDDWNDVPNTDIVVASRSMEVKNIKKALKKLNDKANKRVYLTMKVGGTFVDKEILAQLKREIIPRPDYIYLVNTLHSMGIYAKVDFIKTKNCKSQKDNPLQKKSYNSQTAKVEFTQTKTCQPPITTDEEFIQRMNWSLGKLSKEEKVILRKYFNTTYKYNNEPESVIWAFISWEK